MSAKSKARLSGDRVPDLDRPVLTRGGEPLAVGTVRDARDKSLEAGQREDFLSRRRVPDAHGSARTRGQALAIGAKGHVGEPGSPPGSVRPGSVKTVCPLLRSQITTSPGTGRPLPADLATNRSEPLPVGAKGHSAESEAVCPRKQKISTPFVASQTRTVRSSPTEASRRPSGLYATPRTARQCPVSVKTSSPVVVSRTAKV